MSPVEKGTYYKATRVDGTDFHTGTIKHEVGEIIKPHAPNSPAYICGPGYLHAADVPTETLVVGKWPCRLFEVEGVPEVGFSKAKHVHKGGFKELLVVSELPAHEVFGPQGKEVVALIERAKRLTPKEANRAWDAAWDAARGAARGAARDAARGAAWDAAWGGAARDAAWGAAWDAARGAARDAAWGAARGAARGAAWDAARDAAWGAAAILVRDLISTEHYETLIRPWLIIIGEVDAP